METVMTIHQERAGRVPAKQVLRPLVAQAVLAVTIMVRREPYIPAERAGRAIVALFRVFPVAQAVAKAAFRGTQEEEEEEVTMAAAAAETPLPPPTQAEVAAAALLQQEPVLQAPLRQALLGVPRELTAV